MSDPTTTAAAVAGVTGDAREHRMAEVDARSFRGAFTGLFDVQFPRLFRVLDRLTGDPDLASDLAQEAFVRLYRRGALPDSPAAWLVSVAMNLARNLQGSRRRRLEIVATFPGERIFGEPPRAPDECAETSEVRRRVRSALDSLDERQRALLLLQVEGFSYREIAGVLGLNEASVGTTLVRARQSFQRAYGEPTDGA